MRPIEDIRLFGNKKKRIKIKTGNFKFLTKVFGFLKEKNTSPNITNKKLKEHLAHNGKTKPFIIIPLSGFLLHKGTFPIKSQENLASGAYLLTKR